MPFRQQAATVNRIKDTAAEQLDEITKAIREIDSNINRKQAILQQNVGEMYLRGDDLKQYINMLKAKSSVYKKQRADLSGLEVIQIYITISFFFVALFLVDWLDSCEHMDILKHLIIIQKQMLLYRN